MPPVFLVMLGGAAGSGARYLTGRAMSSLFGSGYPFGTLAVNLVGGLIMGVLAGMLAKAGDGESWRLLLGVGVLGGFTTFSAFALDTVILIERSQTLLALGYILLSVIGSILAVFAGLTLTRAISGTLA